MPTIRAIDAHVGGQPLRLITSGAPSPSGKTLAQKQAWLRRRADDFRSAVTLEPRGHADMTAALLVDPVFPGAHAGIIFMDRDGYPSMSGHGIIAATTIALERGLLFAAAPPTGDTPVAIETIAGLVNVRARVETRGGSPRVDAVSFTNVPAFVHSAAQLVTVGTRDVRVDIAFGGAFYAIVDTEAVGIPLDAARLPDLRRFGRQLLASLNASYRVVHPVDTMLAGVSGAIFTGLPVDPEAHLRNVMVTVGGGADRSACATGTSAVMAVLDAMGLLPEGQTFVHEGLLGSLLRGGVVRRTPVGDHHALVTEIQGAAWITGDHTFELNDDDPFRDGFSI
jgi:proline racemase